MNSLIQEMNIHQDDSDNFLEYVIKDIVKI